MDSISPKCRGFPEHHHPASGNNLSSDRHHWNDIGNRDRNQRKVRISDSCPDLLIFQHPLFHVYRMVPRMDGISDRARIIDVRRIYVYKNDGNEVI